MVHVAGNLPKGEANGLEAHSRVLAQALVGGQKFYVVGVVGTASIKTKAADLVPDPTVEFQRVELIELGSGLEDAAMRLLEAASDERRGGKGQQAFDFDAPAAGAAPAEPEAPLELGAGAGYTFKVVDVEPGRFDFLLCTQYVEGVARRGGLVRDEWSELAPGVYQRAELDEAFRSLADVLVEEWETAGGAASVDVVDAELVEDEAAGADA